MAAGGMLSSTPAALPPLGRRAFCAGLAAAAAGCATRGALRDDTGPLALSTGALAVREWAGRPELMRAQYGEVDAVHYAEVGTALGAMRFAERARDPAMQALVSERWSRARGLPNSANHVDLTVLRAHQVRPAGPFAHGEGAGRDRQSVAVVRKRAARSAAGRRNGQAGAECAPTQRRQGRRRRAKDPAGGHAP